MREVRKYSGSEITTDVLRKMWAIVQRSQFPSDYPEFSDLENDFDMINDQCIEEDSHVILGEDWFINYDDSERKSGKISLDLWYRDEHSKSVFQQTMEAMKTFKSVLSNYSRCIFKARLRHTTSYAFYDMLANRGYVERISDKLSTFPYTPAKIEAEIEKKRKIYECRGHDPKEDDPKIGQWILHEVRFFPTQKVFKK